MKKTFQKLPDSELDLMLVLWRENRYMTRSEIEEEIGWKKKLAPTTILTLLSRLEKKKFVRVRKEGRANSYCWLVSEQEYQEQEGKGILEKLYGNSLKNFVATLYQGRQIDDRELKELEDFLKKLNE